MTAGTAQPVGQVHLLLRLQPSMAHYAVTVVLITFNRAHLLGPAIDALLAQSSAAPPYEVLVVDNNSTDGTRALIQSRAEQTDRRLHYILEAKQGISHARNAGIASASAEIVAFTDDDVRVTTDWVRIIKETFDAHPEVDCVGGRILPRWQAPPPVWLTPRHWVGPLALQDYGSQLRLIDADKSIALAGANFAFRRRVFESIGVFPTEFSRAEDSKFLLRFWQSRYRALYVPGMTVYAPVQLERFTKQYHRRWHLETGSQARLAEELSPANVDESNDQTLTRIFGVPRFALRELATETFAWLADAVRGRDADAFWHEGQMLELVAYMRRSRAHHLSAHRGLVPPGDSRQEPLRESHTEAKSL